ncbi:MAG: hypothetical protein WC509_02095 [Candidatus Izemoplasmatales bacterium]
MMLLVDTKNHEIINRTDAGDEIVTDIVLQTVGLFMWEKSMVSRSAATETIKIQGFGDLIFVPRSEFQA